MKLRNNLSDMGVFELLLFLVVLGILGFTGWFVWNSQQATNKAIENTDKSSTTLAASSKPATKNGTIDSTLFFTYPESWSISQTPKKTYRSESQTDTTNAVETTQVTTLTSPDGQTQVKVEGGIGGVGGACDPEQSATIIDLESVLVPKDSTNEFVAYRDSGNHVFMGVVTAADLEKTKVGSSVCNLAFSSLLPDYLRGIGLISLKNQRFFVKADGVYKAEADAFSAYLKSANYKEAVAIIESIHR